MGSPAVAAWIAHVAFWVLIATGWMSDDLSSRGALIVLALWVIAYVSLPLLPYGAAFFPSFVAVLDIGLVFTIFKGDVHIA